MSLRVYDFEFNLLGECAHPISCEWDLKFNGIGSFEAEFDAYSEFSAIFAEKDRLLIEADGLQAVVTGVSLDNKLRVFGRTPEWLLSKRVVLPFKSREIFGDYTDPETIILYLLDKAYKTPNPVDESGVVNTNVIDQDAVCEELIIPQATGCEKLTRHFWRNAANPLSEVISDLCDLINCGYSLRFYPEEKKWKFSLEFGTERDIIVSKSLKNAYDMQLCESLLDAAQGGFFEQYTEADSEETKYGYIGGSGGSGMLKWDRILGSASGASSAASLLKRYEITRKVECEFNGAVYGTDYVLGDRLRIQTELGKFRRTIDVRVDSVSMITNASTVSVKPGFKEIKTEV